MSTPSTDKTLADAKLALQRRFTQMLVSSKDKSDKIEELLKKSPEFRDLLSASAADVMKQATAMGHSDNATTRTSVGKIAETEAAKVISQLRVQVSAELKTRIEHNYLAVEGVREAIRVATGKCDGALAVILDLSQYEFLTNPASKDLIKIKWNESKISGLGEKMNRQLKAMNVLEAKLDGVADSENEADLREVIRKVEKELTEQREAIKETSDEVSRVLKGLMVDIKEKPLAAYVQTLVKSDIEKFEKAVEFVDMARKYALSVFKASEATNTLNRAFELLATIAKTAGKSAIVDQASKKHMKTHTDAEVRAEHTKDPLLLAKAMYDQQKAALKIFLQGLGTTLSGALIAAHGAGEIVMKVWDPIAESIETALEVMLEARLKQAEEALAAKNAELAKKLQTDQDKALENAVTKAITDKIKEFGKELGAEALKAIRGDGGEAATGEQKNVFQEIAEDPEKLVNIVLKWVLKPVLKKVMEIFPPKPAETVTGADLDMMQSKIVIAQLPIGMGLAGRSAPQPRVFTSMADKPEDVDDAVWRKFLSVDAARTEAADDPARRKYRVAMNVPGFGEAKVWGDYDPRTREFVPGEIDGGSLDDWSNRTVAGGGYSDGPLGPNGPAVRGNWALVTVGTYHYVALFYGDQVHWGNLRAPTGALGTELGPVVQALDTTQELTMDTVQL